MNKRNEIDFSLMLACCEIEFENQSDKQFLNWLYNRLKTHLDEDSETYHMKRLKRLGETEDEEE